MKQAVFTLTVDVTDEYCDTQLVSFGKMLESGEFHKKFTEGIQDKLTIIDARLEIKTKTETNE
jgi:hypothetical protein